jgi:hypothetical protein
MAAATVQQKWGVCRGPNAPMLMNRGSIAT